MCVWGGTVVLARRSALPTALVAGVFWLPGERSTKGIPKMLS